MTFVNIISKISLMTRKRILSFVVFLQTLLLALGVSFLFTNRPTQVVLAEPSQEEVSSEAPQDLEALQTASSAQLDAWVNLSSFDGRLYNYITPERNQGGLGICWAYAAMGAVEANILRDNVDPTVNKDTLDLDEVVAAYVRYNRDGENDPLYLTTNDTYSEENWRARGGHADDAFMAMSQGFSPVDQAIMSDSAYDWYIKQKVSQSKYFVKGFKQVNHTADAIKRAILEYGSVTMEYKAPQTTTQKYLYYEDGTSLGHASLIIGWDDSIKKGLFWPQQPSTDGAWIVKNSWGPNNNDVNGTDCLYLSYESYLSRNFYVVEMGLREDYQNIYYYDGQISSDVNQYYSEAHGAIYEAKLSSTTEQEQLTAVSFGVRNENVTANIKVFELDNINQGNVNDPVNIPDSGKLLAEKSNVYLKDDGFYTIDLDQPINLEQGEYFSIVISGQDASGQPLFPVCAVDYGDSVNDMTYRKYNGVWTSLKSVRGPYADSGTGECVRLRAITNIVPRETSVKNDLKYARVELSSRFIYYDRDASVVPEITVAFGNNVLLEDEDYTVDFSQNINPGQATVKITGINQYCGERIETFEVAKPKYPPGVITETIEVYNNITRLSQIPLPEGWEWQDNVEIKTGLSDFSYQLKYIGKDANFYQTITSSVHIYKYNTIQPAELDISPATITIEGKYSYTGSQIVPKVQVICKGHLLNEGEDYNLSCLSNTNVGTATVIVSGVGQYTGQATKEFQIKKAQWPANRPKSTIKVSADITNINKIPLDCDGWSWATQSQEIVGDNFQATAIYVSSDSANYVNTKMTITIIRETLGEKKDIGLADIKLAETSFVYDGQDKMPNVIASYETITLIKGNDFNVEYFNNKSAGQAIATVSGINNFTGSKILYFTIEKAERKNFEVSLSNWTYGYSILPEPNVQGQEEQAEITYLYSAEANGNFTQVKPSNAGEFWILARIEPSKNYNGAEAKSKFKILPKNLSGFSFTVVGDDFTFSSQPIQPHVSLKDGETLLQENRDYTLSYDNNINAGTATINILGINNYSGSISGNFEIKKSNNVNIDTTLHINHKFSSLTEVKLPDGFVWDEASLKEISPNVMHATALYVGGNYNIEKLEFEIIIDEQVAGETDNSVSSNGLIWAAVALPVVILLTAWTIFIVLRKKRKKW